MLQKEKTLLSDTVTTKPVSQFILPPGQHAPPGGKPTTVGLPPGGQAVPGYLTPRPGYLNHRGASCPGRFILPHAHIKTILLCDVYYYLQHYNNYMQFLSYNYVNLNDYFKHSAGFLIDKGWGQAVQGGLSCPPPRISERMDNQQFLLHHLAPHLEFQREWIIRKLYYTIYYRNI